MPEEGIDCPTAALCSPKNVIVRLDVSAAVLCYLVSVQGAEAMISRHESCADPDLFIKLPSWHCPFLQAGCCRHGFPVRNSNLLPSGSLLIKNKIRSDISTATCTKTEQCPPPVQSLGWFPAPPHWWDALLTQLFYRAVVLEFSTPVQKEKTVQNTLFAYRSSI